MPSASTTLRATASRTYRRILPWALALAVATCSDDQNGPSRGGVGYFAFKPVYGISNSLSQFGVVADSVHILLTRPVNQVVLDTTVFFAPDSASLHLALPVQLQSSPESLSAVIEIKAAGTVLFVDSVVVEVADGPPSAANIPTVILTYVGPGQNVAAIILAPGDTTIFLRDTLFFSATALDSSAAPVVSFYTAWKTSDTTVAKINAQGRLIAPNLRGSVQVIGYTPTGIADTTLVTFAPVPVVITADSGIAQTGLAGDSLAALFVARVKGADSLGISGIAVRFAAVTAGGAVRDTITLVTDANGRVRTRGVLGTAAGAFSYTATVVGTAINRAFSATATAGPPAAIAIQSGDQQVDSAGRALGLPFTVRVADAFNNPASGAKVYWLRTVGTGALALDSSVTNGAGLATTGYTLGAVGIDSVRATLAGTSATVAFQATAISGAAATISKFFGDAQTDTVGRLLTDSMVIAVKSATTEPVVGATVTWTVVRGGTTSSATTLTDAAGHSAVAYTLGTVSGIDSVKAQAGGVTATFIATAQAAAPSAIAISGGSAQTDTAGLRLPAPFTVHVTDAFGNATPGATVAYTVTSGNGTVDSSTTLTNAGGNAAMGYTLGALPGLDSVRAQLVPSGALVYFTARSVPAAPALIIATTGNGQSATVGTALGTALVATVTSGASTPIAGTGVIWTVIHGGILSVDTVYTDPLGQVSVNYTAGTISGTDTVRATTLTGGLIAEFTFTVAAGAPSNISVQSGDAQVDTTGRPLALPFVVRVADSYNNPVPSAKVYWTRAAGGGQVSTDSTFTDGAGLTSVNYVLGPSPSADTVTATIAGTSTFTTFTATGVSASPASIVTVKGDSQTLTVNTLADTFAVLVRDAGNKPIAGVKVDWAFIPAQGSFTLILPAGVQSSFTDALGVARGIYTTGTQAGTVRVDASVGPIVDSLHVFAIAGAPSAIAIQSGNNQTDTLGHAIALPLVVRVADAFNNPVSGTKVAFTRIAGSGTLSADTLITNASGLASVGYLFGLIPGIDTIRADLVGTGANVNFIATAVPGVAATLNAVSGDAQTDTALGTVAAPMVLRVLDANARQVPGAVVSFVGTGGVTPSQAADTADLNGDVSVGIRLGGTVGSWSVTATVVAVPAVQAAYSFTTTPGAAKLIALVSGDGQTDTLGKALALPFVVHVTDASGNDIAGAPVIFTVTAGGGSLTGDTVLTSALGQASIGYTLGAAPGTNTVHAALGGTAAFVDFTSFAVNAFPASITVVSGGGQSAAVTAGFTDSLDVVVKDAALAPIVNGTVIWSISGGGLVLTTDTTFTDASGHTHVRVTAGTAAGTFTVFAQAVGLAPKASFSLTVIAGAPANMTYVSGNAQTDTVGRTLAAPFVVHVADAYGNAVSGAPVTFVRAAGSGTVLGDTVNTDPAGNAAVGYQLGAIPGTDSIGVNLASTGTTITFTATAVAALPASIVATQGNGQTGTVGVTLPTVLIADVKDAGNTPIIGTGVVWTVVRGGSLNVDTTYTNGTGQVAANYTMGTLVGTDSVRATTLAGGLVATFTFTATADVASLIAVQSGSGQVDTTGRTLPLPFTVHVSDAYNNPVAGATVLFSVVSGSGLITTDSVVTSAAGLASTSYALGTTPGLEDVRASLKGTSAFIDFFATAVSGAPALLVKILGDAQTDTVLSTLTDSLVVELRDAASTPIPNTWIYWLAGGATLSADSTLTGPNGRAAVQVTLGNVAISVPVLARNVDTTVATGFTLTAKAGTPTQITAVAGDAQTGVINDTLPIDFRVLLQDAHSNPAQAGVAVTWTNLVGFQPAGLPDTTLTDTLGVATLIKPRLSNFVGQDSLVARIQGKPDSVIFTATTNPGPATSLVYVSGTGQTDTVGRSLTAPMVVQLRDAASNPVVGAWVQWKLISGGGAVPLDSTQTDAAGAASSSLTMGTAAGLDSVRATFAGLADTVRFYALAENDTATALAILSGDGQSATIGSAVSLPVVAQLQDQYGNGVNGVIVTFTPSGAASSVANPSISTDANGQASSGTWTLDTVAGTNTLLAAAGALNKTAGAFALPIGTSKYWNGLTSTDWNTAANWSPAGLPTASDNVFIPVSQPAPVLSASGTTNDLTLQSGGTVDIGSNSLTVSGSLFEGGAQINGTGLVDLAGSGSADRLNAAKVQVSGSYTLTSGAVAQVGDLAIASTGTLDLGGHTLAAGGNVTQGGQLLMKAGGDSLDIVGGLTVNSPVTGAGSLTAGTIVVRNGFQQSGATGSFQPSGLHTTVFASAVGQNITFAAPDSTTDGSGSYFNAVRFMDSTNFTTSVEFRGIVTVDTGKKVTSTVGSTAGLKAALVGDVYADWSFNNTRFWAPSVSVPDSLRGSLELVNSAVSLTKPLAVGGALRIRGSAVLDMNGQWVRVDSAFHSSGTGQVLMTNAADSLDIAGTATIDGGAGSFTNGVLVLRGDLSVPGASAVFQATGSHRTRFRGTATQQVAFANPSLATNRFNVVEFANAAGVNFNSDAAAQNSATVTAGQVTGPGTFTLSADVVDGTGNSWRPEFTIFTAPIGALPSAFARSVEFRGTVTLAAPFRVGGSLTLNANAFLDVNGQALTVDSNLTLVGLNPLLGMTHAADSVDVGFTANWGGGNSNGYLTDGVLVLHGDLVSTPASETFAPSGNHRTRFTTGAHSVSFPASSGYAGNRFQDLEVTNPSTLTTATDLYVAGTFRNIAGPTGTILGSAPVALVTRGLAVNNLDFDKVRVVYSGPSAFQFDNANFLTEDSTVTQLDIRTAGGAPVSLQTVTFQTLPSTGRFVSATDTSADAAPVVLKFFNSAPLDGSAYEQEVAGNDGATILWSSLAFTAQPTGGLIDSLLAPVQVAVRDPNGATLTSFTGPVSVVLFTNPGSATLGGTTTINAVAGIATFSDLTVNSGGIGYTIDATAVGLVNIGSAPFDITAPLPVGFATQWTGAVSSDWNTAGNWSGGTVPDSATNVYVSRFAANTATLSSGIAYTKRLLVDSGAALALPVGYVQADSSVEALGNVTGDVNVRGTGRLTGTIGGTLGVYGQYLVQGRLTVANGVAVLDTGVVTLGGPDTLTVGGVFTTNLGGRLAMTAAAALLDVTGAANFYGASESGSLTQGTVRLSGDLTAAGPNADAFAPSVGHVTVLSGTGTQRVNFATPDSATGSHFGRLQVSTTGIALMEGRYDALGDLIITNGATLADSGGAGFIEHGFTGVDAGATLQVSNLRLGGGLGVTVGGTYAVGTTTYFGSGLVIDPAPYDTLAIEGSGAASGDLLVTGDLRVNGGSAPARFDVGGHTVTVNGSVNVNGNGAVVEQNAADVLNVAGNFFTNGANTEGLLTAGTLQVGGNFRQAADVSSGAFRASPAHTTRFVGGPGTRVITFDSPSNFATDSANSKFGTLDLADGVDSIAQRGLLADGITLGGSVVYDTVFGSRITALDSVRVLASSPLLQMQDLALGNGISFLGATVYNVVNTTFIGGTTLPGLSYKNVSISGPSLTMTTDVYVSGNFGIGQASEVKGTPGDLVMNGHFLVVGGTFGTGGTGVLTMTTGDSIEVTGDINFDGGSTVGHLTGGTLVGRGNFSAAQHSGDSTFVAGKAHRVVLIDPVGGTLYQNTVTEGGMQFGKLYLLDGATRTISTPSNRLVVQDSLVLGTAAGGITGGSVLAKGPVFTVTGSSLQSPLFEVDSTLLVNGTFAVSTTQFGGQNQAIPNLPYANVNVTGTAFLTDSMVLSGGATLNVQGGDLRINGKVLRAPQIVTNGTGTLTMTNAADTVDAGSFIHFFGGNESGKLTEGVLLVHGGFIQTNANSDSSFFASGNHQTRFTDSSAVVQVTTSTMNDGRSRFNDVTITGSGPTTGVAFNSPVWIGGNAGIAAPTIDTVAGTFATLGGDLSDPSHLWKVDTTSFTKVNPFFTDTMAKDVWLVTDTLAASHVIGGELHARGELVVNGHSIQTGGKFFTEGTGVLTMTNPADSVTVGGQAHFSGGSSVGKLTAGRLTLLADLYSGGAGMFDATGTHKTVLAGPGNQSLIFDFGGPQGYGVNDLVAYNPQLVLTTGVLVHGTFADSQTTSFYSVDGSGNTLDIHRAELANVQFVNVVPTIGDSSQVDTLNIYQSGLDAITQLTIRGAGRTTPLDLHKVGFFNLPTTGKLLQVDDTLADANSLLVRMFGSTPFDGSTLTGLAGGATAQWSHLTLAAPLPATIDSAVSFGFSMQVTEPDGSFRSNVSGQVDLTLVNGGTVTLSPATPVANFDGSSASFFGITLNGSVTGAAFHLAFQGQPLDTFTTPTFDVINPAPAGAVIFTGAAADGLWSSSGNWSTSLVPANTDSVFIPAGTSVSFNIAADTVGTLVLGSGASLTILPGDSLYTLGRVAAGNTISGSGTLVLAGALQQVSGVLPSTAITGTATAVGPVTVNGSLDVNGIGAELNVGGVPITVTGTFSTNAGGILTMDGAADALTAADMQFLGGNATGHLTDGTLTLTGATFTQGGDPASFANTGNLKMVFPNSGVPVTASFGDATQSSRWAHVVVNNPSGVHFTASAGPVFINRSLTVAAGAVATGDTLVVGDSLITGSGSNITVGQLELLGATDVQGSYSVPSTVYAGTGQSIKPLPYVDLYVGGSSGTSLAGNVDAARVYVSNAPLDLSGHTLHAQLFQTTTLGTLVMQGATDTLVADSAANFLGGDETGLLTNGAVILSGSLDGRSGRYLASGNHLTRFVGAADTVFSSPFVICGGTCPAVNGVWFGRLETVNANVVSVEPTGGGLHVEGNALLANSTVGDGTGSLYVQGDLTVDATSTIRTFYLTIGQRMDLASGGTFNVNSTYYPGPASHITAAPYKSLFVSGNAVLDTAVAAGYATVLGTGRLALNGRTLAVDSNFTVTDSAHLVMADPLDALVVTGLATFKGDSSEGDYTAGTIRAQTFLQTTGPSGSLQSFVETGSHRLTPALGDTIRMNATGPLGSRLKTIDFGTAAGGVTIGGFIWVSDTLRIANAGTYVNSDSLTNIVAGTVEILAGGIGVNTLGILDSITYSGSAYDVGLTKFAGNISGGQLIPSGIPYRDLEVQYDAHLAADIDLMTGGYQILVDNSGLLDLAGHKLSAGRFTTAGGGRLRMLNGADTLVAVNVEFNGGSTAGLLKAGVIQAGNFKQTDGVDPLSFAPSDSQVTEIVTLGLAPEIGYNLELAASAGAAGSHFNRLHLLSTAGERLFSGVYVADTLVIGNTLNGAAYTVVGGGPIVIGTAAAVTLDTLRVLATLAVDPSATMNVANTVFGPAAAPIQPLRMYQNLFIEGSQTLTDTLTVSSSITLRGGGTLTPNGHKVRAAGGLDLVESSHLVVAAGDTVEVGTASFDGAPSGSDLAGGILRIRNGLTSGNTTSSASFAPTGMVTEFYGGGLASIGLLVVSPSNSYIDSLRVIQGTTIAPTGDFLAMRRAVLKDGSTFDGNSSTSALDFRKGLAVLDTSKVTDAGSSTIFFGDSLTVATPANYAVANTYFYGTDGIPDLPYTYLTLGDGVHDTLTHNLSASAQMIIAGSVSGQQELVLNGKTVSAVTLDVSGYGRVMMSNSNDTLLSAGNMTFSGDDATGLLTAGHILVGADLRQVNGTISARNLRTDGVRVEFYGASNHQLSFTDPDTSASYIGNVDIQGGGKLYLASASAFKGRVDVGPGSTLDLGFLTPANADFFGPVTVASLGTITNLNFGVATFHDTLLVDPAATYNVVNTAFKTIDTIPNLAYQNLTLSDGTNIALAENISTSGLLSLESTAPGGQDLALNGHTVNVGALATQGEGRLTMTNALDNLVVAGSATFDGGSTTGLLTAGTLEIHGNFTQAATTSPSSFDAGPDNTTFRTHFTLTLGTGYTATFATPGASRFGALQLDSDTLHLNSDAVAGYFEGNGGVIASADQQLKVTTDMAVDAVTFNGTRMLFDGTSTGFQYFDNAIFVNMNLSLPQLKLNYAGTVSKSLLNDDFDNAGALFVEATSVFGTPFSLSFNGPDVLAGPAKTSTPLNQVTVTWP